MPYSRRTTRPLLMGTNAMITSGHALASQAGMRVLQAGGNAVDAAVTAGAVLAVVQPDMSGLGGDAFMLHHDGRTGRATAMNASGRAPADITIDDVAAHRRGTGTGDGHGRGPMAASVPGAVRGWADALAEHGTIGLADALAPAIAYAESGFAVSVRLAGSFATGAELLSGCPAAAASYLHADGRPHRAGERLRQADLAQTLRAIATDGADGFYLGDVGRRLARAQRDDGGRLSEVDLAAQQSTFSEPIAGRYRGYTVLEQPPVSLGLALLEELAIVEGFELADLALDSPERAHLLIEAKKLAFADIEAHLTDPEFHDIPVPGLISAEYAATRRASIDPAAASDGYGAGDPRHYGQHTSYLAVVDAAGNAVSWIQSIFERFGSGWMAPGTGFLLNDRMNGFSVAADHVNRVEPGKRTAHTLNAPIVVRDGRPYLVFGTPGGYGQVQSNLQMLTAHLDHGLDIQAMVETPRWLSHEERRVVIESRFPAATIAGLEARGHRLEVKGPWSSGMGDGQAIRIDQASGVIEGAADPRREGYAIAW